MIGFAIITHGNLGRELLHTAEIILKRPTEIKSFSINGLPDFDSLRKRVKETIKSANKGDGVIVLTDLFGGTPSNICITLLDEMELEILSGVNLPMVLRASQMEEYSNITDAVNEVKTYGKKYISCARDFLKKQPCPT